MTEEEKEISDHPPLRERITFLQFVADHPELGNTANKKLLKEKSRKEKFGNDPFMTKTPLSYPIFEHFGTRLSPTDGAKPTKQLIANMLYYKRKFTA